MSLALCICFGLLITIVHLLLLSLNLGTSLPTFFDGQWATAYTNGVVQPLESVLNNLAFNNVLLLILWGFAGLTTYFLVEYTMHIYHHWHQAEGDIQLAGGKVIYHPARRSFIKTVLWRSAVLIIATTAFIAAQPLLQDLLVADPRLVLGNLSLATSLRKLGLGLAGWVALAHCVVVFLRLFLMRTRLFGDPAIE